MRHFKNLLCFLLIAFMLFAVACESGEPAESSEDTSPAESQEESKSENKFSSSTEYTQMIDSLLSENNDRTVSSANLLDGMAYTPSRAASPEYPDNSKLLTNGITPSGFSNTDWAGYYSATRENLTIDFDLGKVKHDLLDFKATLLNQLDYGISAPNQVDVYIAGDDKKFTKIGTAYSPADLADNQAWEYGVFLQGAVSARYIRFIMSGITSVWVFVGEISAVAYNESFVGVETGMVDLNEYYDYKAPVEITEPEYWPESESDYNKTINLVSGIKPQMSAGAKIDADLATEWYNTKNTAILTDGKIATQSTIGDSAWMHTTRGDSRKILFDLGKTSAVSGFSVGFLKDQQPGVYLPRHIAVKVSENGKDWQTIYYSKDVLGAGANLITRLSENFEKTYKARYVELSFMVDTHIYLDEIVINGKKNISGAADVVADEENPEDSKSLGYIMPEDFCGVENMLLSYHCLTDNNGNHENGGLITPEQYLPYVAYLDEAGNIKDTFFDAYLYLPYTRFNYSNFAKSADGWRTYVDNTYYEGRNMDALEKCVGDVYSQLGVNEKAKVFTSILYTFTYISVPDPNNPDKTITVKNEFGDIDGDGKNEDFDNIEDRKKAIKWIMDEEYNRFYENNYQNLEFCGFYWFEEAITYSDPHEIELIAFARDYAHKLGVKLFWIPYQRASGYSEWKSLGFDLACMQPNYMFNANATSDVLYSTAEQTELLGMCVEMEISDPTNRTDASRYTEYMIAGAQTGYMNAVKIYYLNGIPGAYYTACYSKDPSVRKIYDDGYLFAKCKYEVEELGEISISDEDIVFTAEPGKGFKGKIDISELADYGGMLKLSLSPRYGTVSLDLDGTFIYAPPKDYYGEDSFEIWYDLGYTSSKKTTVKIIIEEKSE